MGCGLYGRALGPLRETFSMPAPSQPFVYPTPGTQSRGCGEHRTHQYGGTWTWVDSRCSGGPVRAHGPDGTRPVGDGRLESVEGHPLEAPRE